jgi:hypothetical protein
MQVFLPTPRTTYTVTVTAADDLVGHPLAAAPRTWHFATIPRHVYLPLLLRNTQ